MIYQLIKKPNPQSMECILRKNNEDSYTVIACVEESPDYQAYLKWLAEGNTPEPADEVTE
jgi:isocitrate dehydrogenase